MQLLIHWLKVNYCPYACYLQAKKKITTENAKKALNSLCSNNSNSNTSSQSSKQLSEYFTSLGYNIDKRPHVQPIVTNGILCLLHFPVFMSSSMSPLPHSHPLTPRAATTPRWRKCQHLLRCDSFGLRSRSHVTTVENHCDWISKPTAGMVWLNDRG